ncbi:MAG: DNA polymerase elongation subunit (family B) [Lentimonas sp.]|jgi:DNA polymerase elongation subunit (family B)
MMDKVNLEKVLFLDIETVPQVYNYNELEEEGKAQFIRKSSFVHKGDENEYENAYNGRAGIYAEFGKIVCISVGFVHQSRTGKEIRMKSFAHDDEETLLKNFSSLLEESGGRFMMLCGHNAKEFDFPYICRRMLINGLKLPEMLNIAGKKPWEIAHLDTMELWKFGDFKAYTSLSLLCYIFKIPTPKDDISGADVARVYYEENDLERIKVYCEKDVLALIQLFLKMRGENLIDEGDVYFST